jgi:protein SCO1/2
MNQRLRLTLMAIATIVLLGVLAFVVFSDPAPSPDGSAIQSGSFAGAVRPETPPASFTLRDEEGRTVDIADYRGQPVVVTFLYTACENECPTIAQQVRGALDRLGTDVPVVAVSVDPEGDTQASARRFLARQKLGGRMRFLLGSEAQLQPVWRAFGIAPQTEGREHSASVVLLSTDGRQAVGFPISELTPEGVAADLRRLGAGQSRPGN